MRTLNPILAAGLAGGYGEPIVRLKRYQRTSPLTLIDTTNVIKYEMSRFTCNVWVNSIFPFSDTNLVPSIHILERGLKINGVEYTVQSPYWYFVNYQTKGYEVGVSPTTLQKISLSAWDTTTYYNKSTAADVSAATVIQSLLSYGCTAAFSSLEAWHTWQWEKSGAVLRLSQFNGIIPMLWSKYTAKMFPRDNGTILFKTLNAFESSPLAYPYETAQAEFEISDTPEMNPAIFNIVSEDENGVSQRLSVTYGDLIGKPLRNIGFLPSTADKSEVHSIAIAQSELGLGKIVTPINLKIEQGEHLMPEGMGYMYQMFANVTESYNMKTQYPWQTEVTGERMWFNSNGA